MRDPEPKLKKKKKRSKPKVVYVEPVYPAALIVASFVWALVGWLIASQAPRLAFVPGVEVLHVVCPLITAGFIGVHFFGALRNLWNGVHPLRLVAITGLQIGLFTTLFFQLFAHFGAEHFDIEGSTQPWNWIVFSLAHAFRASDVFDFVEAFSLKIQSIKHHSLLTAGCVIAYHFIIDLFVLSLVWSLIDRARRNLMEHEEIRDWVIRGGVVAFVVWLFTWWIVAFFVQAWRLQDIFLWFAENVLRVIDFLDVMESTEIRLHTLPRAGIVGVLTFLCRVWIAVLIGLLAGQKKLRETSGVATPPKVSPTSFWLGQTARIAVVIVSLTIVGFVGAFFAGDLATPLAEATAKGPADRSEVALRALRRMGPRAAPAIPVLMQARPLVDAPVRTSITRTLGYLGDEALESLGEITLADDAESAETAMDGLKFSGTRAAPVLVRAWKRNPAVRNRADKELYALGSPAVPILMEATTSENSDEHFHWFQELDPNWRLQYSSNRTVQALQTLPALTRDLANLGMPKDLIPALQELKHCGTAGKRAVVPVVNLMLKHSDAGVRSAAAAAMATMGPEATQELVRLAGDALENPSEELIKLLTDPALWDLEGANNEGSIRLLTGILGHRATGMDAKIALMQVLADAGPKARRAVPELVALLGPIDANKRPLVHETLKKINPAWRKDPAISEAIPGLLPWLSKMSPDEAKDLVSALGTFPDEPTARERLQKALTNSESVKNLSMFGPKFQAAAPVFIEYLKKSEDTKGRALLAKSLPGLMEDFSPTVSSIYDVLGLGDEVMPLVEAHPKEMLPYLANQIETKRSLYALKLAARLKSLAKDVIPSGIHCVLSGSPNEVEAELVKIDKDWRDHPGITKALGSVIDTLPTITVHKGIEDWVFTLGHPTIRPVLPNLIGRLAYIEQSIEHVPAALDKAEPKWREHEAAKTLARVLLKHFDESKEWRYNNFSKATRMDMALASLGGPAVTPLADRYDASDKKTRDKIYEILVKMLRNSKHAIGPVISIVAQADQDRLGNDDRIRQFLTMIRQVNVDWTEAPGVSAALEKALVGMATTKGCDIDLFAQLCETMGPSGVPMLAKIVASGDSDTRILALIGLNRLGEAVLKNKEDSSSAITKALQAVPSKLTSALEDKNQRVRNAAVAFATRFAAEDKSMVPVLLPLLLDEQIAGDIRPALQKIDPNWKKHPKVKEMAPRILDLLKEPNRDPRAVLASYELLEVLGPIPGSIPLLEKWAAFPPSYFQQPVAEKLLKKFRAMKK